MGKRSAGVVGQDPADHDGIVLGVALCVEVFGEVPSNGVGGLAGGIGTRLGGVDNGGEVQILVARSARVRGARVAEGDLETILAYRRADIA